MAIRPAQAIRWIRARKTWKAANTRRGIAQLLHHVFALAVRHRMLPSNPVAYLGSDFPAGDRRRPLRFALRGRNFSLGKSGLFRHFPRYAHVTFRGFSDSPGGETGHVLTPSDHDPRPPR